jgi:stearoyl-CoA desaturase (delta-9 desaturase)
LATIASAPEPVPASAGILTRGRPVVANRLLNAVSILAPIAGTAYALWHWERLAPTALSWALFAVFFAAEVIGVSLGLHRYFTHKSFETSAAGRALLGVLGSLAFQAPIERWVADHRRHHRYTDGPLDPHSPHWIGGRPPRWRWLGLLHAHVAWMFYCPLSDPARYAPDIARDPIARWCTRLYWPLCGVSLALPAALGYALGGAPEAARGFFWAGCFRVALLQQITWTINSVGHAFGAKEPGARDESRNSPLLAIALLGEGLHGFHHRHPTAAVFAPERLDLGGWLLTRLERLGLVWNVKRVR